MILLRPLLRARRWIGENLDLLGIWWLMAAAQPLVPDGHLLARSDLAPWFALALTLGLLVRGAGLGEGPHPMLSPRRASVPAVIARVALALVPATLLCAYEAGRTGSPWAMGGLGAGAILLAVGRALGAEHGRTAWRPSGAASWLVALPWAGLCFGGAAGAGWLSQEFDAGDARYAGFAILAGLCFLGAGLYADRAQDRQQRRRAGNRDGRAWWPDLFKPILAAVGPSLGLWLLLELHARWFGVAGFEQAFAVALHALVWVAILCPPPPAAAIQCVLHEVVPVGGADEQSEETATSFERPPEGALRLQPVHLRRTRAVHLWLVPIHGARIHAYDDPIRPLWSRPPPPLASHVLGEARFDPDPATLDPQTEVLTVRLKGNLDVSQLGVADAQTRRVAVLRAWPASPWFSRRRERTYRWEAALPAEAVQVVDATTEALTLRDGDVLVLSTEGVARAYELEFGAEVPASSDLLFWRLPQIEDYAKA